MIFTRSLSIFFSLSLGVYITFTKATTFDVVNQCPYTVWVASPALPGWQLDTGESRSFNATPGTNIYRIWGRTNCSVDDDGQTKCQTGDCSGLSNCQNLGSPPLTLAEINLNGVNGLDFIDISLVNGFNIPMELGPAFNVCRTIQCSADINGQCPEDLQTSGGCYGACHVFKTNEFCCNMGRCGPTEYSRFFKKRCPDAHSYTLDDDTTATFPCSAGTNYKVVFCPSKNHALPEPVVGVQVSDVVTDAFFNGIINQAAASCEGKSFYTRQAFLDALSSYSQFGQDVYDDNSKREIAAFFAHVTHETEHFCYINEVGGSTRNYCDESNTQFPCNSNKSYYGRGPLMIAWNFNYALAGSGIGFDGLNSPETVASDVVISFKTALWFWMNSIHSKLSQGFGETIRAINVGECNGGNSTVVSARVEYYQDYCSQFGVSTGRNLTC